MRVQIPHNELRPLIKEGYEKVYDAMSRLLAPEEMIFAKWEAGFGGILQWTLPSDMQWRSFTQGDDYDKQSVITEFLRLKNIGEGKLGTNQRLKQAVYSIPSESSVYFAMTPDGKYHVMLTAWGYSFPTQAPMTDITWQLPAGAQDTTVRFIDNGAPMAQLPVDIHRNGVVLHHQLDDKGERYYGKLTPGTELHIEVPSLSRHITLRVMPGQTVYTFDMTQPQSRNGGKVMPPQVDPPHEKEEEVEEIIAGHRSIKLQFIGADGAPIRQRNVILNQLHRGTTTETTDDNGCIYISTADFAEGTPISLRIPDVTEQPRYADASLVIEADENDYAVIYSLRNHSDLWVKALLALGAAALTALTIWGALQVEI